MSENIKKSCVYFITDGEYVKIGVSNNVMDRLMTLQTANARVLRLLDIIPTDNPYELESKLHSKYYKKHMACEWYDILDKYVKRNNVLLDPEEVHDYFRLNNKRSFDKIAYHCAVIGTYVDRVKQVTKAEYDKYLQLYQYMQVCS